MAFEPRIAELLARYPHDLSDEELAELRACAEADPAVEQAIDDLIEIEARLAGVPDGLQLSELGRKRLERRLEETRAWSTGGATPSGKADADAPQAWSTGGATPSGRADAEAPQAWSTGGATPSGKVVDFEQARRRRGLLGGSRAAQTLAAGLLIASGFMVLDQFREPPLEFTFKGDDDDSADPDLIEGSLWIHGETKLESGAMRRIDQAVTFRGVTDKACSLVLLETQAGQTYVLFPEPGQVWEAQPGSNLLDPAENSSEYRPGRAGEVTYTLLASPSHAPIPVPQDRKVASPEAMIDGQEATYVLDSVTILWQGVE
jgi:hypothetical protein